MKREIILTIAIPEEMEKEFRVFSVLHGGSILSKEKNEKEEKEKK